MAFEVGEASYTAPSGKKLTFLFENVTQETDKKTATTTFPELDGAQIQDLGVGGRRFPLTCIFSGDDCMKQADAFEELLLERGVGILKHPVYGQRNVVPTGTIKRSDGLVSNIGESTVETTFSETLVDTTYPDSEVEANEKIEEALEEFDDAAAEEFVDLIETDTATDRAQLKSIATKQIDSVAKDVEKNIEKAEEKKSLLQRLNDFKKSVKDFVGKIQKGIDKVEKGISYAFAFAHTAIKLVRLPARIAANALAKINGYTAMALNIAKNVKSDPFGFKAVKNQFAVTQLLWSSAVASVASGTALTASEQSGTTHKSSTDSASGAITSRAAAMEAVGEIQSLFNDYKTYLDKEVAKNSFVDSSDTYEKLLNVVTLSVQALTEYSFNLETVKIITLDRDRQIIELLCELYGKDGFERMDEFINENNLNADEIVCLPMGREVRYYV